MVSRRAYVGSLPKGEGWSTRVSFSPSRPCRTAHFAALALAVGLSSACKHKLDERVVDTEGRTFQLQCGGAECSLKRQQATPVSPDKSEVKLSSAGRIIGICDAAAGDENPPPYDCRPITCTSNASCPPALGLEEGVCVNNHCIEPSREVTVDDAVMLCLAGTGTGRETPKQAELYVLAFNCGRPCQVPRVCEQP